MVTMYTNINKTNTQTNKTNGFRYLFSFSFTSLNYLGSSEDCCIEFRELSDDEPELIKRLPPPKARAGDRMVINGILYVQ